MTPDFWLDRLLDIALSPTLWLSIMLSLTYSALFYAWRGGGWRQLGRDLLAGLAGFGAGQAAGALLEIDWLLIGQMRLFTGTLGSLVALFLGRWLAR
jgi:hypothetical protein